VLLTTIIASVMAGIASLYLSYRGTTLFLQWWLDQRRAVQTSEQSVSDNPPLPVLLERLRPELPWPPENWEQMLDEFLSRHPEPSATNEESKHLANWSTTYYRVPERRQACHCFDMRTRTFRAGTAEAACVCGHPQSDHTESGCTATTPGAGKMPEPRSLIDLVDPNPTLCVVCGRHVTITPADPAALCPDCMSATQQQVARPQRQWPLTTRGMAKGSAAVGYDDCEPCNGWEEM
jgi:hypothetical protein